jgi:hypothetical protein
MDVDVDGVGRHVEPQERDRKAAGQKQASIRLGQGMLQAPVANEAAVQEQVLHSRVRAAVIRTRDEPREPHVAVAVVDRDQVAGQVFTEKQRDSGGRILTGGQIVNRSFVMPERETNLRIS